MKRFVCFLTAWVWLFSFAGFPQADRPASEATLWVFKYDGAVHCGRSAGIAPQAMAPELAAAGITVFSMRKGHDGREGIALCGQPTGQINLFEIPASQLSPARDAGFRPLSGNVHHHQP